MHVKKTVLMSRKIFVCKYGSLNQVEAMTLMLVFLTLSVMLVLWTIVSYQNLKVNWNNGFRNARRPLEILNNVYCSKEFRPWCWSSGQLRWSKFESRWSLVVVPVQSCLKKPKIYKKRPGLKMSRVGIWSRYLLPVGSNAAVVIIAIAVCPIVRLVYIWFKWRQRERVKNKEMIQQIIHQRTVFPKIISDQKKKLNVTLMQ